MSRVFITGSADGLGLAAARLLVEQGHRVVGHARGDRRAADLRAALPGLEDILIGDLGSDAETRALAGHANRLGRFDAVVHNAGVGYREPRRIATEGGHAHVLAVNVLAPYLLTALMERPGRLVYLSSGMHRGGDDSLDDIDWRDRPWQGAQAYADSKLFDAALALAVARHWPDVLSNAVEPGWVPTRMGGAGAPDDLSQAHLTQCRLAVGEDPGATVTGGYFYHQRPQRTHPAATSLAFQDRLLAELARLTGTPLDRGAA
jgi:NAD(P)-dependent dehydrogenase (short-subunit alcohol dehydrogenase family)